MQKRIVSMRLELFFAICSKFADYELITAIVPILVSRETEQVNSLHLSESKTRVFLICFLGVKVVYIDGGKRILDRT